MTTNIEMMPLPPEVITAREWTQAKDWMERADAVLKRSGSVVHEDLTPLIEQLTKHIIDIQCPQPSNDQGEAA